ncbi:hypothetical protein V4100_001017 [Pseudomonas aeruginosa]
MNSSISTIIGIIGLTAVAFISSQFEHKIDVFCSIMAFVVAAWFIFKNINDAFGISMIISMSVTIIALYYGFTNHSIAQAVAVSVGVWMLTLFKVLPFILGLLFAGSVKALGNKK